MKLLLTVIIIHILFILTRQVPQFLEEIQTCDIFPNSGTPKKKLTLPNYITAENEEISLHLTICGEIPEIYPDNTTCRNVCLFDKKTRTFIHPGDPENARFELDYSSDSELEFKLQGNMRCTVKKNYDIRIKMVSNPSLKKPRLTKDSCKIELEMLKPDYVPPCTYLLKTGQLIDLRPLRGESFVVPFKGAKFHVSICGSNKECDYDASACSKIGNETNINFASTKYQRIDLTNQDQLKAKSSYRDPKSNRMFKMEVTIDCDWNVETFSNGRYLEPLIQGKTYKFRVDSSFGCVKLPTKCLFHDSTRQLSYDLRKLYKKDGYRLDYGSNSIDFNLCGELSIDGSEENDCNVQKAQVCEISGDTYVNRGSNPMFYITNENYIQARFTNGQKCNGTEAFSTIIHIKCSFEEKLSIQSTENCLLQLLWLTPNACPKFETKTSGCSLSTPLGKIDISSLYTKKDRIYEFSNTRLEYNICGKIHSNCSTNTDTVACLTTNERQQVIGRGEPTLSYIDGNLSLKYTGDKCGHVTSSLIINLICSYINEESYKVIRRDECNFVIDIPSIKACFPREIVDCTFFDQEKFYDLTPLISMEKNYKINDTSEKNITYHLNICTTLLNGRDTLTFTNSMVSMENKSEPHILNTFQSLGKISRPYFKEGSLKIHSNLGFSCAPGIDYSSIIHFECASDRGRLEFLRKNSNCVHEFMWRTKYACPKMRNKCYLDLDLPKDNIEIEINSLGLNYIFNLCSEEYTKCFNNSCSKRGLVQQAWKYLNNSLQLELNLEEPGNCLKPTQLEIINITLNCDPTEAFYIRQDQIENCKIRITILTRKICKIFEEIQQTRIPETVVSSSNHSGILEDAKFLTKTENPEEKQSTEIRASDNGTDVIIPKNSSNLPECNNEKFNLKNIKSSVINARSNYVINFDNSINCDGLICKNGFVILSNDNCPSISYSETFINLSYSIHGKCSAENNNNFNVNFLVKCGAINQKTLIKYEDDCKTVFESFSPEVCDLISNKGAKLFPLVIGIIIILLSILIIAFICYKKNYCRKCSYTPVQGTERTFITHFKEHKL